MIAGKLLCSVLQFMQLVALRLHVPAQEFRIHFEPPKREPIPLCTPYVREGGRVISMGAEERGGLTSYGPNVDMFYEISMYMILAISRSTLRTSQMAHTHVGGHTRIK